MNTVLGIPHRISSIVGDNAVAAVEGAFKKLRYFFRAFALGELSRNHHSGMVCIAFHAKDMVNILLRDRHGKSGGRVALRLSDPCDLFILRWEQAQLVCLRELRRFGLRFVRRQLYTSSFRIVSSACAFRFFISPTHFI